MTLVAQSGLKHLRGTCCVRQKGRLSFLYLRDVPRLSAVPQAGNAYCFESDAAQLRLVALSALAADYK